jgi:hypothetical protein
LTCPPPSLNIQHPTPPAICTLPMARHVKLIHQWLPIEFKSPTPTIAIEFY